MGATLGAKSIIRAFEVEATTKDAAGRRVVQRTFIRASSSIGARAVAAKLYPGHKLEVRETN